PAPSSFPPVASDAVAATVVAAPDGPTTNREASSASGITGSGSGGTLTALIIATAFRTLTSGSMVTANTGTLGSEADLIFGSTGFTGASDNFGLSLGNTGFCAAGSLGRRVNSASGLDRTGFSNRGGTGTRMARCGSRSEERRVGKECRYRW